MTKRLLAVLAHPDDESFGLGGTLAKYAREGVEVHVAIATDGVAGSVVESYEQSRSELAAVRAKELETAVAILGGTLHRLGYRDSGYLNDPANDHAEAFINADQTEAVGRVVKLIRQIRPQVVLTHDETGGYFHPDHIQCWKIVTPAFFAAGDAAQYPEIGPAPYQPERLLYSAISARWIRVYTKLLRLRGLDPTKLGRNQDIDMTRIGVDPEDIAVKIDYRPYWNVKMEASAAHASQGGGGIGRQLPEWLRKWLLGRENYILAYPEVPKGQHSQDLFA